MMRPPSGCRPRRTALPQVPLPLQPAGCSFRSEPAAMESQNPDSALRWATCLLGPLASRLAASVRGRLSWSPSARNPVSRFLAFLAGLSCRFPGKRHAKNPDCPPNRAAGDQNPAAGARSVRMRGSNGAVPARPEYFRPEHPDACQPPARDFGGPILVTYDATARYASRAIPRLAQREKNLTA